MAPVQVNKTYLLLIVSAFILLVLSLINIKNFTGSKKVLGAESPTNNEENFWKDFMDKNPNYLPGLIETGKMDKVKKIDPNFELDSIR